MRGTKSETDDGGRIFCVLQLGVHGLHATRFLSLLPTISFFFTLMCSLLVDVPSHRNQSPWGVFGQWLHSLLTAATNSKRVAA